MTDPSTRPTPARAPGASAGQSGQRLPSGTVTFLFTDIEDSTKLWEMYPEAMHSGLAKHDAILKKAIETNHGQIIKTTGDGIHAVFEKAIDAILATIQAQRALSTSDFSDNVAFSIR